MYLYENINILLFLYCFISVKSLEFLPVALLSYYKLTTLSREHTMVSSLAVLGTQAALLQWSDLYWHAPSTQPFTGKFSVLLLLFWSLISKKGIYNVFFLILFFISIQKCFAFHFFFKLNVLCYKVIIYNHFKCSTLHLPIRIHFPEVRWSREGLWLVAVDCWSLKKKIRKTLY